MPAAIQPPSQPLPPLPAATGPDPVLLARGAERYGRMCAVCHGEHGEGYKADEAPALAHPDFLGSVTDDFLRYAIGWGRQGTTMSAWGNAQGGPLSDEDVRAVILHMRSWQQQASLQLDDSPRTGDSEHGQVLFKQHCERCHGPKGPYVRILSRQFLHHAGNGFMRQAIQNGRAGTPMAGFQDKLGDKGIDDVIAYFRTLPNWLNPGEIPGTVRVPPLALGPVPLNPKGPKPRGFKQFPEITPVDVVAKELLKRKARMVVLDARAPSDYSYQHIAGSVSVPFYDPSPYLDKLPKTTWMVCYCACPHAESMSLAKQLRQAGFTNVTVLDEGFGVWIAKGHPTSKGPDP